MCERKKMGVRVWQRKRIGACVREEMCVSLIIRCVSVREGM